MRPDASLCVLALLAAQQLGGCQMPTPESAVPAILSAADADTMAAVKATLAGAMQTAQVEIGPGDLTVSPTISVLPAPLGPMETASPALPVQFDLMVRGKDCLLVRHDTGKAFALDGVTCLPLQP